MMDVSRSSIIEDCM